MRLISPALFILVGSTLPVLGAEVRLRSSASCTAAVVRVADVAEVFADDARVARALSDITLCPAPAHGGKRSLTQADVQHLIALSGVERKTVQITGSETVTVATDGALLPAPAAKTPLVAAGVRQAAFESNVSDIPQPRQRFVQRLPATSVEEKQPAAPPLVDRGEVVTVSARTAGVRITTSGKALDAGAAGETIGIELADSKQRVLARITGPQSVEVAATSAPPPSPLGK